MGYEREKEQVLEALTNNNVPPNVQHRFITWSHHPSCDAFVKQTCDYVDAHFSMQKLQLRLERRENQEKVQQQKMQLQKRFSPRRAQHQKASLQPANLNLTANHLHASTPAQPAAPRPPKGRPTIDTRWKHADPSPGSPSQAELMEKEAELGVHLQRALAALAKSYLFILFNFGDFCKIHEDETFFWCVSRLTENVIRLEYGISAQKRAEVELNRLFYSQMFNKAQRKHREDPEVSSFILGTDKKSVPRGALHNARRASRVRSNLLSCFIPTAQEKFVLKYANVNQSSGSKRGNSHNPCGDPNDKWRTLRSPKIPLEPKNPIEPLPMAALAPTPMAALQMGSAGGHNAFMA